MNNFNRTSSASIDRLIDNIGVEESKKLLIKALPIIVSRKADILQTLEKNDMRAASEYADIAVGSIRLYGSSRLEELLVELTTVAGDQVLRPDFHSELESEFDLTISEIQERLRVGLS